MAVALPEKDTSATTSWAEAVSVKNIKKAGMRKRERAKIKILGSIFIFIITKFYIS